MGHTDTLDPPDWDAFQRQAEAMLGLLCTHLRGLRDQPVWQPPPEAVRARHRSAPPRAGDALAEVCAEFATDILPYGSGNTHPGFMGWVQGGGTPVGMLAEMLAAGLNANVGGRDHMAIEIEREVIGWSRELLGLPEGADGLFVTGTSMANFIAVLVARSGALGAGSRRAGLRADGRQLTAYASAGVHGCVARALDMAGIGADHLRLVPVDDAFCISLPDLRAQIAADRAAGALPFLIIGTAGTVDTGAIDDLDALADIAAAEGMSLHVDGAFGALAALAPGLRPRLRGLERADSVAFDWHKWGQVPYDAGCILVREGHRLRTAFAGEAAYLSRAETGLAAGAWWPCDLGPDLSRGFRALKVWMTLKVHGTEALGRAVQRSCDLAQDLAARVAAEPELELLAPAALNIVCFGYRAESGHDVNAAIVEALHVGGRVAPSLTRIGGRPAIRAALVNHRTDARDIEALVAETIAHGRRLTGLDRGLRRRPAA